MQGTILQTKKCKVHSVDAACDADSLHRFNMARSADPQGSRTVGIITKCDAVQEGDEESVSNWSSLA